MRLEFFDEDRSLATLAGAQPVLDRFYWNVSVEHTDDGVELWAGLCLVAQFSSMEELEIFTAGMTLALQVLPDEVVALIDQLVGE